MHDEVVPGVCRLLRDNGVQPTVFLNSRISETRGDLFDLLPDPREIPRYRPLRTRRDWSDLRSELGAFDVLVANTFQTDEVAEFVTHLGLPTIGLVHNPRLFLRSHHCVNAVTAGRVSIMTLAPHVTAWLRAKAPEVSDHVGTITHCFWEMETAERHAGQVQRITVPGEVRFRSRDHVSLLESIPRITQALPDVPFEIAVIGSGRDRADLEKMVADAGMGERVYFAPVDPDLRSVPSPIYYRELARSAFLLGLLPPKHPGYRTFKITSVVPASIGLRIPAILDRPTARVYGVPCVPYRSDDTASGIIRGLSLGDDEYRCLRTELEQRRLSAIEQATSETARLLASVRDQRRRRRPGLTSVRTRLASLVIRGRARQSGPTPDRDDRAAFLEFARNALRRSYAQRFQDLWALWECGFPTSGYFVEFGAQDGGHGSNTYLLEQLGWRGVVAEPHPDFGEDLRRTRRCAISTKCVYDRSGEVVRFRAVKGRPALSTIEGFGDDLRRDLRRDYVVHDVETISLNDLLTEASAPRSIDFLSIDTEGSEMRILQAFDFSRHEIACVCVEHNFHQREDLRALLTEHGFRRKWPRLSGHDDWYVNDVVIPQWDPDRVSTALSSMRSVSPDTRGYRRRLRLLRRLEHPRVSSS
jgi:FkbM family methyltransferase